MEKKFEQSASDNISLQSLKVGSILERQQSMLSIQDRMNLQKLIVRLAKLLYEYGAPSFRVERRIEMIAEAVKMPTQIVVSPNTILISFGGEQFQSLGASIASPMMLTAGQSLQSTVFLKVQQRFNLSKLYQADRLAKKVAATFSSSADLQIQLAEEPDFIQKFFDKVTKLVCSLWPPGKQKLYQMFSDDDNDIDGDNIAIEPPTLSECIQELKKIDSEPDPYSTFVHFIAVAGISFFGALMIYKGTLMDGLISLILGLISATFNMLDARKLLTAADIWSPMVTTFLAVAVSYILKRFPDDSICLGIPSMASIISLFPGLHIVLAMMELASNNILSGSVRMFYAFIRSLKLGFGMYIGAKLIQHLADQSDPVNKCAQNTNYGAGIYLLLIPFSFCVCIVLKGSLRQWPQMLFVSAIGVCSRQLALYLFSLDTANSIAAFSIGTVGNILARRYNQANLPSLMVAITLLVPTAVGVYGFFDMLASDKSGSSGSNFAFDIIVKTLSIAFGLYFSSLVYFPIKNFSRKTNLDADGLIL
ncbi:hypothetical protein MP228_007270 [Amoeboaphelidium protococcarum]|nr:hypothetical protein MP228_007270 [Amoeboaphelidium protococcarum]